MGYQHNILINSFLGRKTTNLSRVDIIIIVRSGHVLKEDREMIKKLIDIVDFAKIFNKFIGYKVALAKKRALPLLMV